MTPDDARTVPDTRRQRLRAGAGLLAIGFLLGACGGAFDAEQARKDKIAELTRQNYVLSLKRLRPDYVFITYPGTIGSMRDIKKRELEIVRSVLDELKISHETIDRSAVRETITVGKAAPEEVYAFRVPDRIVEQCGAGTVIFLNLDVHNPKRSARHPDITGKALKVLVWDDPVQINPAALPAM